MRKLLLTGTLIFSSWVMVMAPCTPRPLDIPPEPQPEPEMTPYEALIQAIFYVETGCDSLAYNPAENAVGGLQIRQIRLDDYNMRTGKNYTLEQMYDFSLAKEVFIYYAEMYQDHETIAKRWNGSGPMTIEYWNKVKSVLYGT